MKTTNDRRRPLAAALLAALAPLSVDGERFEFSGEAMGGEARIVVHAPDEETARGAAELGFAEMTKFEETRALDPTTAAAEILTETITRLEGQGVQVAFSSIAAGLACDLARERMAGAGFESVLVEAGGVVVVGAAPPGTEGWSLRGGCGVSGFEPEVLAVSDCAIAYLQDEDDYGIAVLAREGATADALAAGVFSLGRHVGRAFIDRWGGARLFLEDARFVSLFDGSSLEGWVTEGGPQDGDAVWTVEEGAITGAVGPEGEGGLLYTKQPYTSFALELETRVDQPFDSGVFLRVGPDEDGVQVTLDNRPKGEIGAIFSDVYLEHCADGAEAFRQGAWNHVEIRCTGFDMHVEVWVNGRKVTDYQMPPNSTGYAPTGLIGLQVHAGKADDRRARFRNVRIHELPLFGENSHAKEGWMQLFNGRDLSGWEITGHKKGYRVKDGELFLPTEGSGHVQTVENFRDFRLQLEFKLASMANSGVFLRAARDGSDPAFSGCEIQILDDLHWEEVTGEELEPWEHTGSLYGSVAPLVADALKPIGEWNRYEILFRGPRLAVALNGRTLLDVDTREVPGKPFSERAPTGFIGLQHHAVDEVEGEASIWFRKIYVERLDPGD